MYLCGSSGFNPQTGTRAETQAGNQTCDLLDQLLILVLLRLYQVRKKVFDHL